MKGVVLDSQNREAVAGAVVELTPDKDPDSKKYTTTSPKGRINASVPVGNYSIKISFLGYKDFVKSVSVGKGGLNLGSITLDPDNKMIDEVVIAANAIRTSQQGDTVNYNADAFKVTKDADVEGLIKKMPGITVNSDGSVEAQGEEVKKVFVDGKEFFGDDVSATIKNLPAEVVSKIEVYNKLSDQAQFSGVDDGEGYKAINIVTRSSMRTGTFGKMYAGYGYDNKYFGGGNVNLFAKNHRVSFIGLFNNINQLNFSTSDILGVMGSEGGGSKGGGSTRYNRGMSNFMVGNVKGVSSVASVGTNYIGTFGDKLSVQGSYFFNTTNNSNISSTDRQYFSDDDSYRKYLNDKSAKTINYNHNLAGKIDYKIDDNNALSFRPRARFQSNYSDSKSTRINSTNGIEEAINSVMQMVHSDNTGYNISLNGVYQHKLAKAGRTLTIEGNGSWNNNERTSENLQLKYKTDITNPGNADLDPDEILDQHILNNSKGYSYTGSVMYTEPLTDISQMVFQYRARYNYSEGDKRSFIDRAAHFDPLLSNISNSGYLVHRVGPGYRYGSKTTTLIANVFYQRSELVGDREYPLPNTHTAKSFNNVTYFGMVNTNFNPQNSLRMFFRSSTNNPSINQLQDVVDRSDLDFTSSGNSQLVPTYTNDVVATYTRSSVTKGRTFMVMGGFNLRSNYIANSIYDKGQTVTLSDGSQYVVPNNVQFTMPINMNGYWGFRGGISFGTPINFIKSNINFNLGMTLTNSPNMINLQNNVTKGQNYNAGVTLGSNISDKIDFNLSYNAGYNMAKSTLLADNNNNYWNQTVFGSFKWITWRDFTLTANANYYQYTGITTDFSESYVICNLAVGKKVLKSKRGEINVGVNDLFDQNTSFSRNITDTYIENVRNNVLGRYVTVSFTYNLRSFGNVNSSKGSSADSFRGSAGNRPSGGFHGRPMH